MTNRDEREVNGEPTDTEAKKQAEIDLLDLLYVFVQRKRMIAGMAVGLAVAAFAGSFLMTPKYKATTVILPPQQRQSLASSLVGQLGPLASLVAPGLNGGSAAYVSMLQSRSVGDNLVKRFHLLDFYKAKQMVDARKDLAEDSTIASSSDGLITISVELSGRQLSADLANAYVNELQKLTQRLAEAEATDRRMFFERQLQNAKTDLSNAEEELRATQEKTGMVELDSQARTSIESVAQIQAEIATREVQLRGMRESETSQNPDMVRSEQELEGMKAYLENMQKTQGASESELENALGKIPASGLEYVRKLREVKYRQAVLEIIAKQYEAARLDEAKTAGVVQVVDQAVVPERKSKPVRRVMAMMGGAIGMVLAIFWCFLVEVMRRLRSNPEDNARMEKILDGLIGKRRFELRR